MDTRLQEEIKLIKRTFPHLECLKVLENYLQLEEGLPEKRDEDQPCNTAISYSEGYNQAIESCTLSALKQKRELDHQAKGMDYIYKELLKHYPC